MDNALSSTFARLNYMRTKYLNLWVFSAFKVCSEAEVAMLTVIYKDPTTGDVKTDFSSKSDLSLSYTNDTAYKTLTLSFTSAKVVLRELQFYQNFMSNLWLEQAVWR